MGIRPNARGLVRWKMELPGRTRRMTGRAWKRFAYIPPPAAARDGLFTWYQYHYYYFSPLSPLLYHVHNKQRIKQATLPFLAQSSCPLHTCMCNGLAASLSRPKQHGWLGCCSALIRSRASHPSKHRPQKQTKHPQGHRAPGLSTPCSQDCHMVTAMWSLPVVTTHAPWPLWPRG